jgi:uncharacterized membrane protein YeaQ/YmgE (transglycosylase-associated protein family)
MELPVAAQAWVHLILVWIGFGTVVGFVANLFLPSGSPPGFFGNLVIGIAGSCAGPVAFVLFMKPEHFHPMSPLGFAVAVFTAIIFLMLYRGLMFFVTLEKKEQTGVPLQNQKVKNK